MLTFAQLTSRIAGSLREQATRERDPHRRSPQSATQHLAAAHHCRSLCLGCDARTPCSLGRIIG